MIRKFSIFLLIIIAVAFLSMLLLPGCKARQVAIKVTDSSSVKEIKEVKRSEEKQVDKTTLNTKTIINKTDSSETKTVITPAPGETIHVNPDGSFTGKADKVETTTKKRVRENQEQNQKVQNDVTKQTVVDTKTQAKEKTEVHKKEKDIKATPNNGWLIYLGIAVLIVFVGVIVVKKFF